MKKIPLTRGMFALVDDADFDFLNQWKWYAHKSRHIFYAARNIYLPKGKQKTVKMHRVILSITNRKVLCDHINGNGLDNQRHNLRPCSNAENTRNGSIRSNNTTGKKGVHFRHDTGKFQALIQSGGKRIHLGYFKTAIDAADAYDAAAKIYYGEFAKPNLSIQ